MGTLSERRVVLGITGGIAAYKSAELVRALHQAGADVRVVMTEAACEFITPLTLQALSGNPVHTALLDPAAEAGMGHIELARWADLLLVAPATADFLARLAGGQADDLLTAICLATSARVALAPAMNQGMWTDPATRANVELLGARGHPIFGPGSGEQACGDVGPGRMREPAELVGDCESLFTSRALDGRRVVVTAGPTREPIDPVRFISNRSSGRMGFALARAAVEAGAATTLVTGPVTLATPERVRRVDVETASQMLEASLAAVADADIFIATAAVADYRPQAVATSKIKKSAETLTLDLVRNPDILAEVAAAAKPPFCVGFAAETDAVVEHARDKLERKRLAMIVANDVGDRTIGFDSDDNAVTVLWPGGQRSFERTGKQPLADALIQLITEQFRQCRS